MPEPDLIELFVAPLEVSLAPPEYVITRKLEFHREGGSPKHLRDIRAMLEISADLIDRPALERWIQRLGLEESWSAVQVSR